MENIEQDTKRESEHEKCDRLLFNNIAETYCQKDILPASRIARKHRLRKTFSVLPPNPNAQVLEIGCGAGFSACYLDGLYSWYEGVDYADSLIDYAQCYNCSEKTAFHSVNINDYHPDRKFDIIFMIGVLHHLDDIKASLLYIKDMLKPGGWIVANEPQSSNLIIQIARGIRSRRDASYSGDQIQFSPRDVYNLYAGAGLTNIIIKPQGILSTPLAEVIFKPRPQLLQISRMAVFMDNILESVLGQLLLPFTWNLIIAGQRP